MDYLLRPVLAGMCRYESLKDGSLDLLDVSMMNYALTAKAENDYRVAEAARASR
jgi:hypothetical protein